MIGGLNKNIILHFQTQFENKCVQLLLDSHKELHQKGGILKDTDENTVTVQLVGYMKTNPISTDYKIDITREYYIDSQAVYAGDENPDTSPRIDIRFMTWTTPEKFEYFFEAKNLYEKDFVKPGNKTPVSSRYYQKRYISTGIQNFINGKYPRGCLVGYVLEGNVENIAADLNEILKTANRNDECLVKQFTYGRSQYCFISTCSGTHFSSLAHYFLSFEPIVEDNTFSQS